MRSQAREHLFGGDPHVVHLLTPGTCFKFLAVHRDHFWHLKKKKNTADYADPAPGGSEVAGQAELRHQCLNNRRGNLSARTPRRGLDTR